VHHLAAVFDLVEHYRREVDLGELVLNYETLVADQAGQTERLLDYLGLPFEDACLRFHENSPLCTDAKLRAGHREAERPLDQPSPALRTAAHAIQAAARSVDGGVRLRLEWATGRSPWP